MVDAPPARQFAANGNGVAQTRALNFFQLNRAPLFIPPLPVPVCLPPGPAPRASKKSEVVDVVILQVASEVMKVGVGVPTHHATHRAFSKFSSTVEAAGVVTHVHDPL